MITNRRGYSVSASQAVAVGGSSTPSAAISANTTLVRVCSTVDTYIAIGASPTATSSSVLLPAKVIDYFQIRQGELIACLQVTGAGSLSIAELTV